MNNIILMSKTSWDFNFSKIINPSGFPDPLGYNMKIIEVIMNKQEPRKQ